jgi:L-rhamnose-H+ transport protein
VPHAAAVYASAPSSAILSALLFGAGWGIGGIFFGLGIAALGLSLGTSVIMGLVAIGGSIVPMLMQHREQLFTPNGRILIFGICLMLAGLLICGRAGSLKSTNQDATAKARVPFGLGLFYCVAAGLLSALVNFALIFGAPITQPAIAMGPDLPAANNAVWVPVFIANYLVNFLYCMYLGFRKNTLRKFLAPSTSLYWLLAIVMGLLWAGGIVVYGRGATLSGIYGPVFGFPIMLIISILTGNLTGALLGEWRGASRKAVATMICGVVVMLLAILALGRANYLIG